MCTGNICRSPLAHKLFEKIAEDEKIIDAIEVDSCGIGAWHEGQNADARMRAIANKKGLNFKKYARQIRLSDVEKFDYLIAMDSSHVHFLRDYVQDEKHKSKIYMMRDFDDDTRDGKDVPDPYYGGSAGFETVYNIIDRSSRNLLQKIKNNNAMLNL